MQYELSILSEALERQVNGLQKILENSHKTLSYKIEGVDFVNYIQISTSSYNYEVLVVFSGNVTHEVDSIISNLNDSWKSSSSYDELSLKVEFEFLNLGIINVAVAVSIIIEKLKQISVVQA